MTINGWYGHHHPEQQGSCGTTTNTRITGTNNRQPDHTCEMVTKLNFQRTYTGCCSYRNRMARITLARKIVVKDLPIRRNVADLHMSYRLTSRCGYFATVDFEPHAKRQ